MKFILGLLYLIVIGLFIWIVFWIPLDTEFAWFYKIICGLCALVMTYSAITILRET